MAAIKRVISVKNFRGYPRIPEKFEETQWDKLESAILCILNSEKPCQSYEELHRIVENLQSCHCRALLHENLHSLLENDLIRKVDILLARDSEDFLESIDRMWNEFCQQIITIKNIFLYFDRSSRNGKYNTIQFLSYSLFRSHVVYNLQLKRRLINGLLETIKEERDGANVNIKLLKSLIGMLTELQVYDDIFQPEFIKVSEGYYSEEGNRLVSELDTRTYLMHVSKRINEEQQRTLNYLNKYTGTMLLETVYKFLIKDHLVEILDRGFEPLLDSDNIEALSLMYDLLKKVFSGVKSLIDYFTNYINKKGLDMINDLPNEKNMIQNILDFKDKLDNVITVCFKNNESFHHALRVSFAKFINSRQNKPAQLLAKYIDSKLRCKEISDEELEACLDKVMVMFRFIQGKDIFEAFYKRDLAKRLLLGKSTSQDAEDSMIAKLKLECGSAFTSKIEGMFNDIHISQSIHNTFKQYLANLKNMEDNPCRSSSECMINVLTSSYWPNYPNFEVNLPVELANYQIAFQKFYAANHNGRKLFWQPSLGHCVVKATFEMGNKELQVSLFQTLVLLLFNNSIKNTYKEIQEATNLEEGELKRTLISLACGKTRVLVKQSKGTEIEDDEIFAFNSKFTDKLFRVRVNQIQLKESLEEEKATEKNVLTDRQFQIDAAIVRIMKSRKMISHNALISELFNVLDVPVKPSDLKKRIELLIERDYMERDKDNTSMYLYLA